MTTTREQIEQDIRRVSAGVPTKQKRRLYPNARNLPVVRSPSELSAMAAHRGPFLVDTQLYLMSPTQRRVQIDLEELGGP